MRGFFARLAVVLVLLTGVAGVAAPEASSAPSLCGWLTVTVDGDSHNGPVERCDPPPPCGGFVLNVGHYEHDLIVTEVIVDGWLCVRGV